MIFAPNPIVRNPSLVSQPQPAPAPTQAAPAKEESAGLPQNSTGDTRDKKLEDLWFSDIYFTPEKVAYVWGGISSYGLKVLECLDLIDFYKALEEGYQGNSSYSITYGKSMYRIERIQTVTGPHYSARRMPHKVPDFFQLGIPSALANHLASLNKATGLILVGGPTGMGKTTTITALLKYYLENEGGFAYTIEDPPEMPLDGIYQARKGGLGLCKQTEVVNGNWDSCLKSALRSRPRYIFVGEIRTPETASEVLRAATSGHLVLSSIHANNLEDAVKSLIKYAAAAGLNEDLAADLLARGILGVVHQKLAGTVKLTPSFLYCFANPDTLEADRLRIAIRDKSMALGTLMEAQMTKILQGKPLFPKID
ncbi:MAG: Flp pilus assembly complex ATPase component TadA [Alphaproteobacteria bacterium]|nr:Flp pilus assembly complex ATPase component TadA [Alphaproteobacteria bacterium]